MFAKVSQDPGGRLGIIYFASVALSSAFVAWIAQKWWKRQHGTTGDEGIFDDVEESPLFDPNFVFPAKLGVKRASDAGRDLECVGPLSMAEREGALRMARGLMRQLGGGAYNEEGENNNKNEEEEAESSSSGDETNVSLNYHIATELEKEARDSLVEAVIHSELLKMEAQGKRIDPSECANILAKLVEYFDISNEREKLRERRIAMRPNETTNNGFLWANSDGYNDRIAQQMAKINEAYAGFFSRETEMDQRLRAFNKDGAEERFEMDWDGADDDDEEADLMNYLDQDDAAGYGSRMELRMKAMGRDSLRMMDVDGEMNYRDDDDDDDDDDGECEEEEESDDIYEKTGFERMLLDKLHQLAASLGEKTTSSLGTGAAELPRSNGTVAACDAEREKEKEEGSSQNEWETESDDDDDEDEETKEK
ncbi:Present in the outer mitochondrial membrane proteome 25 [Trypanosoma cruzi]|uniref:Present in the outer mitochondrial membrane proteome 25 n=2 Tax=Trypanosoma cruzi TaxID=5693 RepID=Q4DUT0_TRYCC|nr:hypothetical protein, conserved [Trypanosoma cruzi]EAN96267.1 hypothetical protein, conserved [Trypanosoma cruzi]PWV12895.1 Present in the outer mitochondrial membrane proteome 25 [Trypanosoma cruzi]RNC44229.1 hypothetical protein TcCL_NonESM06095 [Trypanosoma cruzi]|eukprot:XP_818118.1 hypothetical protein [Trypanosoma cruzi strain CL Brener]